MKPVIEEQDRLQGQFKPVAQCCHQGLRFLLSFHPASHRVTSFQGFRIGAPIFLTHIPRRERERAILRVRI